jgi:hypothetical protein
MKDGNVLIYPKVNCRRDSRRRDDRRYDSYPRRRRRSPSPTPILNYDDQPSNEGVELFPEKLSNGRVTNRPTTSRSRSPASRRRSKPYDLDDREERREPVELFPEKMGGPKRAVMDTAIAITPQPALSLPSTRSLLERISDDEPRSVTELFPEKVAPPKSLAERIQDDIPETNELFPDTSRTVNRRSRRRKAVDHF